MKGFGVSDDGAYRNPTLKPDISEFSYGFAVTSELIQKFGLKRFGAPSFPTQYAEGQTNGGFDAKLPAIPLYLQFKRSDCLTTANAKEYAKLGIPYYRFKIRALKHSQQHDLLLDLEAKGNVVFYAAPRFHKPGELNDAFSKNKVVSRSAFVAPSAIGALPDLEEHALSFGPTSKVGILRSESREVELANPLEEFDAGLRARLTAPEARRFGDSFFRGLGDEMINIFTERRPGIQAEQAQTLRTSLMGREAVEYARFVALSLFDCELLVSTAEKDDVSQKAG